ncbi:MAG: ATP-binding protein [Candidatus Paceibacterota bacterium]|jgi:hypothetical protein
MTDLNDREYKIRIDPRILELLGPSLYTNIYYVLAELIANAYDASASNVYIIQKDGKIIVEDDGIGMSYSSGDIERYLNVAVETRTNGKESLTIKGERKRMGRKGIGKLAALSVSEKVLIMTRKKGEVSGFVLSRHINEDHKLKAIDKKDINFKIIKSNKDGTSVVMTKPQYGLHKTVNAIKNNLLKIFPLVNKDFKINIITEIDSITIDSFDKEMINGLGALITFGEEFENLFKYFNSGLSEEAKVIKELLKKEAAVLLPVKSKDRNGKEKLINVEIKGWIGAYRTTTGRKKDKNDFPDNFISLLSNKKLGEYNILPLVGKNKLQEVYIVGQLHVDAFEDTELPDMALSNRQGYKTDDPRYEAVISLVRDHILPQIINMRIIYAEQQKKEKEKGKIELQGKKEEELKKKVNEYKEKTSERVIKEINKNLGIKVPDGIKKMMQDEMNRILPIVGLKENIDSQKKKILISHTKDDKALCDIIYKMLSFNGVLDEDIIYTNCDNEDCRIPNRMDIFDYLRKFFVDSYSNEKVFVIYVTSNDMARSWGAVSEVGAGWITQKDHDIFSINGYRPDPPLNTRAEWHTSKKSGDDITMNDLEIDKFIVKIRDICNDLGYKVRDKVSNKKELKKYLN